MSPVAPLGPIASK